MCVQIYVYIMRLFANMVLRSVFGIKREEVAGNWRTLDDKDIHNLQDKCKFFPLL